MQNLRNQITKIKQNLKPMENTFIPTDYHQPKADNNYLRLEDGENAMRILTTPLMGWEGWVTEGEVRRPMRVPFHKKEDCRTEDQIKHFWALGVYDYKTKAIKIWSFTQATIIEAITSLANNSKWGDCREYDITIVKSGEKMNTKYTVMPNPKEPLSAEITQKLVEKPFDLTKLFKNEDPFEVEEGASNDPIQNSPNDAPPPPSEEPPAANKLFD